jgi:hypothetical protein
MAVSKAKPVAKKALSPSQISQEKKPTAKKSAASKVEVKPPAAKPKAGKSLTAKGNGKVSITAEQRYRMICDAAYFRAERRGFIGGNQGDDWVAAEAEVDVLLRSMLH